MGQNTVDSTDLSQKGGQDINGAKHCDQWGRKLDSTDLSQKGGQDK